MGFEQLLAMKKAAAEAKPEPMTDCPVCEWSLKRTKHGLHCPFCGWTDTLTKVRQGQSV